jgi:hypothetical protein
MTTLTEEMILAKTRCKSLEKVRNLNMFGCELEDLSVLKRMPSLEVLSLSGNRITSLRSFSHCVNLQELYLRKNFIEDLNEVHSLRGLKYLHTLYLEENACTNSKDYRKFIIYMLPRICKLDGIEISNEERDKAEAEFQRQPIAPIVPALNGYTSPVKNYSNNLPPKSSPSKLPSPRTYVREPSPRPDGRVLESPRVAEPLQRVSSNVNANGLDSPRIVIGEARHTYNVALKGETNKHVLAAILSLVKELNLDGLMMLKTDVDSRMRSAIAGAGYYPIQIATPVTPRTKGGEV